MGAVVAPAVVVAEMGHRVLLFQVQELVAGAAQFLLVEVEAAGVPIFLFVLLVEKTKNPQPLAE